MGDHDNGPFRGTSTSGSVLVPPGFPFGQVNTPYGFVLGDPMRFLIVRTDIRTAAADDLRRAWADGHRLRDETTPPSRAGRSSMPRTGTPRCQLARALASVGAVRAGRQRVKVVRLGEPEHAARPRDLTGTVPAPASFPHRRRGPDRDVVVAGPASPPSCRTGPRRPGFLARDRRGNDGHGPGSCAPVVRAAVAASGDQEQRDRDGGGNSSRRPPPTSTASPARRRRRPPAG